jgi:hypothetical protein
MEEQLRNGVDTMLKDGTIVTQPVQPMALSAMLRELKPIVQEPVRVKEAADGISPPISLNTNNPAVVTAVVNALRDYRESKIRAAKALIEGEVISSTESATPTLEPHNA